MDVGALAASRVLHAYADRGCSDDAVPVPLAGRAFAADETRHALLAVERL
jgi:hypothetical protein